MTNFTLEQLKAFDDEFGITVNVDNGIVTAEIKSFLSQSLNSYKSLIIAEIEKMPSEIGYVPYKVQGTEKVVRLISKEDVINKIETL